MAKKGKTSNGKDVFRINEIFYSLQGEGHFTGTPAVFVRFSGCNMKCDFCDTKHDAFMEMTAEEILDAINVYESRYVVLTGGEPAMQVTERFVDMLHEDGWFVQAETNGSIALPENIDWVTCSPKRLPIVYREVDELKVVYQGQDLEDYDDIVSENRFLQPCGYGDAEKDRTSIAATVECVKRNPDWRLSLQTHKLINIP